MFTVLFELWLAVNVPNVSPFCLMVSVPSFTVGMVGVLAISE